jgi:hypothetical protein
MFWLEKRELRLPKERDAKEVSIPISKFEVESWSFKRSVNRNVAKVARLSFRVLVSRLFCRKYVWLL